MDQWQQLFNDFMNGVTHEVEQFVDHVFDTVDALTDIAEETVVEAHKLVVAEIERTFPFLGDETFWAEFWDFEDAEDLHNSFNHLNNIYGVESMASRPAACEGCSHFHGQVYNGNPLVCGMHPFGPQDQSCADWSQE